MTGPASRPLVEVWRDTRSGRLVEVLGRERSPYGNTLFRWLDEPAHAQPHKMIHGSFTSRFEKYDRPSAPDRPGLWRLLDGEWRQYVRGHCTSHDGFNTTHAVDVTTGRCACGRRPVHALTAHPTDTVSQIDCEKCLAFLLGRTL